MSNRWSDPRARLLDGEAWEAVREDTLAGLNLNEPVQEHLKGRVKALDAAWQLMAERLEEAGQDAKLIEAQARVPIVKFWGEGLLASVDGLRFVVPKKTIHAGPSPKYYHFKRGITWLNAANGQVAGMRQMVVPGTPRDSPRRYSFASGPPREGLRPLRDPTTVHLDEDDDGKEQ